MLKGQVFGQLSFICYIPILNKHGKKQAWFECDCGEFVRITNLSNVTMQTTKSCGCLQHTQLMSHGAKCRGAVQPEYKSYSHAKQRCTNNRDKDYKDYGGRGIEFKFKSFEEFYKELGPRPTGMSLDRKDNDGNYEKGNVRWATMLTQCSNRRTRRCVL